MNVWGMYVTLTDFYSDNQGNGAFRELRDEMLIQSNFKRTIALVPDLAFATFLVLQVDLASY